MQVLEQPVRVETTVLSTRCVAIPQEVVETVGVELAREMCVRCGGMSECAAAFKVLCEEGGERLRKVPVERGQAFVDLGLGTQDDLDCACPVAFAGYPLERVGERAVTDVMEQ